MFARLAERWEASDRYTWLTEYLSARGLETRIRTVILVASIAYCSLPLTMLHSPSGPRGRTATAAAVVAAGCVALGALPFAWRWPTRAQAVAYALIADAATSAICLSYENPLIGLVGCMTFALIGGYVAFFHCGYLQVVNLCVALVVTTILGYLAWRSSGDAVMTLNVYAVVVVAAAALSVAGQLVVHFLGLDLAAADTDPLTGLLNRRAFYRRAHQLLATNGSSSTHRICVTMVDLDHFKRLNDTRGHRFGDSALIMVAKLIEDVTPDGSVVARVGGEEFVVAEIGELAETNRRASMLCEAIAASEFGITASIGVAGSGTPTTLAETESSAIIDELIEIADSAMYDAKRAGGSQARQAARDATW